MTQKNLIKRLSSSTLVQTFLVYISGGWIMLEMADYFISHYGLNDRTRDILLIVLLAGLPVAIFLAWFLTREKAADAKKQQDETGEKKSHGFFRTLSKKPWFSIPGILVILLLLASGIRYAHLQKKIKWATGPAIDEIYSYWGNRNHTAAFHLINEAMKFAPENPEIQDWASRAIARVTFLTDPPGAEVFVREYANRDDEWELLGTTPIDSLHMPGYNYYEFFIGKEDYDTVCGVLNTQQDTVFRKLFKHGTIPEGMVHIYGFSRDFSEGILAPKRDYFIDKYEVTNKQFKKFVDSGGYRNPAYWKNEFIRDGKTITWEEAMNCFTDKTGRPGPATWEASNYPEGQGDYPVNGISWYEAAAYAVFAGKDLPSWYHWYSAAGFRIEPFAESFGQYLIPLSNMKDNGPVAAGYYGGIGCFGSYDIAGNVREWCWNGTQDGRVVMGGAWNDVSYIFTSISQAPPFDRSPKNGFRCVDYMDKSKFPEAVWDPFEIYQGRDFYNEKPVSDEVFEVYRNQFLYDKTDLQPVIEERDESYDFCNIEKISFQAAYENDRMIAYLFLPKHGTPPYQTLIFYPGSYAVQMDSLPINQVRYFANFLPGNNIAFMWPVYKGTYERNDGLTLEMHMPNESHTYTEYLVKWIKDYSRSIDYLETRDDINSEKIGFYGHSWGGMMGAIIPAIEVRTKLSVIFCGGLNSYSKALPEADLINYVTRVKSPVLMLHGKYDFDLQYETDAKPMYDLLGTPAQDKVLKLYETDHFVPKSEVIKETLNFMEKYFGPAMN